VTNWVKYHIGCRCCRRGWLHVCRWIPLWKQIQCVWVCTPCQDIIWPFCAPKTRAESVLYTNISTAPDQEQGITNMKRKHTRSLAACREKRKHLQSGSCSRADQNFINKQVCTMGPGDSLRVFRSNQAAMLSFLLKADAWKAGRPRKWINILRFGERRGACSVPGCWKTCVCTAAKWSREAAKVAAIYILFKKIMKSTRIRKRLEFTQFIFMLSEYLMDQ